MKTVVRASLLILTSLAGGCVGTTGGELLEVNAYAAGPVDAAPGLRFETSQGYEVTLARARIFVGGVYLNLARPTSVASDTSCTLAGTYVTQVLGGREIDLLSPEPQALSATGLTTTDRALTGEVWLSDRDVDRTASSLAVLTVAGSAERDGKAFPFRGRLSIGQNRVLAPSDAALPGQNPICKQRIVSPIALDLVASPGDALILRVDPRGMFANVDFSTLSQDSDGYRFADASGVDQASDNLYAGLRRNSGVYDLSWQPETDR